MDLNAKMSYTELESGYQDLRQQSSQQAAANSSQQTHHVLLAGGSDRQQPCPGFFVGHDGNVCVFVSSNCLLITLSDINEKQCSTLMLREL